MAPAPQPRRLRASTDLKRRTIRFSKRTRFILDFTNKCTVKVNSQISQTLATILFTILFLREVFTSDHNVMPAIVEHISFVLNGTQPTNVNAKQAISLALKQGLGTRTPCGR